MSQDNLAGFLWSAAVSIRGNLRQSQYGWVTLWSISLGRLECVVGPYRDKVLKAGEKHKNRSEGVQDKLLRRASELQFYNTASLMRGSLSETQTRQDLFSYVRPGLQRDRGR